MCPPDKAFATRCGLLRACSLLRRFSTCRSTVRGAIPSCCAHCFDERPLAMHCRTSRSRSDRVTKSSCCPGKFTIGPLSGKSVPFRPISLVITALQPIERTCPDFGQCVTGKRQPMPISSRSELAASPIPRGSRLGSDGRHQKALGSSCQLQTVKILFTTDGLSRGLTLCDASGAVICDSSHLATPFRGKGRNFLCNVH